jgi:hypothetical protein
MPNEPHILDAADDDLFPLTGGGASDVDHSA